MNIKDISVPEVYQSSADFRFFLDWFEKALTTIQYDTENLPDVYDPLRCKAELLWMLSDTMGYKFDDRLPVAFCRLVLLYFMSMIRHKGSKDGVTLAAEVNLAQFNVLEYGKEKDILYNRLEDTSIPVNSVYVNPHTEQGYIDVVYFSDRLPIDACIEYVRPVGMYLFQHAGVRYDARTKLSIDARLTNTRELNVSIGPTHVGHYSRDDYARMQRYDGAGNYESDKRQEVYYRNSEYEKTTDPEIDPGYRTLYSLQMSNNEHIVKSLVPSNPDMPDGQDKIFSLGYGPQDVKTVYPDSYLVPPYSDKPVWNLRYDKDLEESIKPEGSTKPDVYTVESGTIIKPDPAVNPVMTQLGDAMAMAPDNSKYTKVNDKGFVEIVDTED